jgi:hypothetical protein
MKCFLYTLVAINMVAALVFALFVFIALGAESYIRAVVYFAIAVLLFRAGVVSLQRAERR